MLPLPPHADAAKQALVLDVNGAIGPAIADYVVRNLQSARPSEVGIVIVRMNTPGGLDSSMREINAAILASSVPVATYVAPNGARAASAGTYIAYASSIAAMAPGTNIGAATPIQLRGPSFFPGGGPQQPSGQRNGQGKENPAEPVIDVIADDVPDLLRRIDGRSAWVAGKTEHLMTAGLEVVTVPPDWRTEILAVITNPNVAFILMLLGIYGLLFEFLNPGAVAPGLVGALSLLVALYALNLLPVNYAGAALVLLGIGLMVAEAHIGTLGLIGVAGVVAFVIGAIMMFPSGAPGLTLSLPLLAGAAVASVAFFLLILAMLLRSRRRAVVAGAEALIGAEGETLFWQGTEGRVRIRSEVWRARAAVPLQPGTRVKVIAREGLVVVVEPA